jgi:hypothetical protein
LKSLVGNFAFVSQSLLCLSLELPHHRPESLDLDLESLYLLVLLFHSELMSLILPLLRLKLPIQKLTEN